MAAYRKYLVPLAVILGIALIVVGIVYFAEPAKSLPSFFPGHLKFGWRRCVASFDWCFRHEEITFEAGSLP